MTPASIVLVGFTGCGKSTVGRLLASRLGWEMVDTDEEVVRRSGKTIAQLFHGEGEAVFRTYEYAVLGEALERGLVVVAAGAGLPLFARSRQLLAEKAYTVHLSAEAATIVQRLRSEQGSHRNPVAGLLLSVQDPYAHVTRLLAFRLPYYACADVVVPTDHRPPDRVADEVLAAWRAGVRARGIAPAGDAWESQCPYVP